MAATGNPPSAGQIPDLAEIAPKSAQIPPHWPISAYGAHLGDLRTLNAPDGTSARVRAATAQ